MRGTTDAQSTPSTKTAYIKAASPAHRVASPRYDSAQMIPPRIVLSAVDFSDASRVALTFAARLAVHSQAALHIVHVEDQLLAGAARAKGIDLTADTREELDAFVAKAVPAAADRPALHIVSGDAPAVVSGLARRLQADVVVLGMRGISALEHVVFGSTTESVLKTAAVPVCAVPDGWTPPEPDSPDLRGTGPVVAAIEETDEALAAAAAAARLARLLHARVEALHVVAGIRVLSRWQPEADALVRDRQDAARRVLEPGLRAIDADSPIELRVEAGNVAQVIADAVATAPGRHPILVMGRRQQGAGATAYRILNRAVAPVLQYTEPR
jgi:nucleotide-binding universal stress UspA family protein